MAYLRVLFLLGMGCFTGSLQADRLLVQNPQNSGGSQYGGEDTEFDDEDDVDEDTEPDEDVIIMEEDEDSQEEYDNNAPSSQ